MEVNQVIGVLVFVIGVIVLLTDLLLPQTMTSLAGGFIVIGIIIYLGWVKSGKTKPKK
ncbi:MAG: hypothetical protein V1722_00020 [Candidatus Micrarchaeota archaeon]